MLILHWSQVLHTVLATSRRPLLSIKHEVIVFSFNLIIQIIMSGGLCESSLHRHEQEVLVALQ